jgi:hypothetical protein
MPAKMNRKKNEDDWGPDEEEGMDKWDEAEEEEGYDWAHNHGDKDSHKDERDSWERVENNKHCWEITENTPALKYAIDPVFDRILHEDAGTMPYKRREDTVKTTIHWGQRKLLLSEIEFLTLIGLENLKGSLVVYAGAAPGTHVTYLASMFPTVDFMLVDPADFTVRRSKQISIKQECFTDKLAARLREENKHRNVYFVSDIRTADPNRQRDQKVLEERVAWDMTSQMQWHNILKPKQSMLKLRFPWFDGVTEYLDGDIYLPVWGPQTTTECRLITNLRYPHRTVVYDNRKYESQMMYFNNVTRHSLYHHNIEGEGLDHCYDCTAEIHILKEYLRMHDIPESEIPSRVSHISWQISRAMKVRRTLLDDNPDPETRRINIARRQHDKDGVPAYEHPDETPDEAWSTVEKAKPRQGGRRGGSKYRGTGSCMFNDCCQFLDYASD